MCQECLTRGLWAHEETKRIDDFINGFIPKKNRKPAYEKKAQPPAPSPQKE